MADQDSTDLSTTDLSASFDDLSTRTRSLETAANGFARAMGQAFGRATTDARSFDSVLKSLALRISNLAVRAAFRPLERGLASGISGLFGGTTTLSAGDENLLSQMHDVQPFARGGVIASPTYFPLGRGLGLAGEAGAEAIMPLARGPDGRLGVAAAGGAPANLTINITTPDAASFRRSETYVTGLVARAVARGQRGL
jgi:phage-related minor tail protein